MTLEVEERGETKLVFTRAFKAPLEKLFAAHTDAAIIQTWMLGPEGWTMPECESDPKPGGKFRFTWAQPGRESFSLNGTYVELDPPHRIVHREEWDAPGMEPTLVTTEFAAEGEGTRMTMVVAYATAAAREAALATGMVGGMVETYDRLDRLAA